MCHLGGLGLKEKGEGEKDAFIFLIHRDSQESINDPLAIEPLHVFPTMMDWIRLNHKPKHTIPPFSCLLFFAGYLAEVIRKVIIHERFLILKSKYKCILHFHESL